MNPHSITIIWTAIQLSSWTSPKRCWSRNVVSAQTFPLLMPKNLWGAGNYRRGMQTLQKSATPGMSRVLHSTAGNQPGQCRCNWFWKLEKGLKRELCISFKKVGFRKSPQPRCPCEEKVLSSIPFFQLGALAVEVLKVPWNSIECFERLWSSGFSKVCFSKKLQKIGFRNIAIVSEFIRELSDYVQLTQMSAVALPNTGNAYGIFEASGLRWSLFSSVDREPRTSKHFIESLANAYSLQQQPHGTFKGLWFWRSRRRVGAAISLDWNRSALSAFFNSRRSSIIFKSRRLPVDVLLSILRSSELQLMPVFVPLSRVLLSWKYYNECRLVDFLQRK